MPKAGMIAPRETLLLFSISLFLHFPTFVLSLSPPFSCDASKSSTKNFTFCNTALSIEQRVEDLIARLSVDEKISQLGDQSPPIPRLGVPAYKWWSESLHGVSRHGRGIRFNGSIKTATSFPQIILSAASFDPLLWYRISQAVGTEARALYNAGQAEGLTFWAPNINILRDPRWGRGQETPGEDPMMAGKYAVSYVRGLQGDSFDGSGSPVLKVSACCKHFTAYDLDNWNNITRYIFNAVVSVQDLQDTYQPPFQMCVEEARASGMMCSYNKVNGIPACADYNLLSETARGSWGFYGYIASDCDAVSVIHEAQGYTATPEDAVADVLKAGTSHNVAQKISLTFQFICSEVTFALYFKPMIQGLDVNCGGYLQKYAASASQQGKISENDIDRALRNLFSTRMRLGLFNGNPKQQIYGNISSDQVCSKDHQNLALEAAKDGIVLLKNSGKVLPLSLSYVTSLGVIGLIANNASKLIGNYEGPPCTSNSPLQVLQNYVKDTKYVAGCDTVACNSSSISDAVQLASSVDYVILFMGLDQSQEKEKLDRENLVLPGMQQSLVTSVARAAKRPVLLVLICGGPVDVTFAKHEKNIGAILWAGYPGESGGLAIAQVIFGEHNPGGRLPVTWYPQEFTRVPMTDMRMRTDAASGFPGRTYRFYTGNPVFKFGYGLSYSTYAYRLKFISANPLLLNISSDPLEKSGLISYDLSTISSEECEKVKFSFFVTVKNRGPMEGKHSVLLFLRRPKAVLGRPMKQLIAFEKVSLKSGEKSHVEFLLSPCEHFAHTEEDGMKVIDKGSHFLVVGKEELEFSIIA